MRFLRFRYLQASILRDSFGNFCHVNSANITEGLHIIYMTTDDLSEEPSGNVGRKKRFLSYLNTQRNQ